jgi:uncharacterized protein
MAALFLDSSALVKRYQNEAGSSRVTLQMQGAEQLLIARLAVVEVSSALVRRAKATGLSAGDLAKVLADLDRDVTESMAVVELDALAMTAAIVLARKHGLRGADAIQLACAMGARRDVLPAEFTLLSSDDELNAAAASEGLRVENPTS